MVPMNRAAFFRAVIVFDLDGVIVDSRAATAEAIASVATSALRRPVDPGVVNVIGSPPSILQGLGVVGAYGVYRRSYDAAFKRARSSIRIFDEVVSGVKELKEAGVGLGVVTAQPKRRAQVMLPAHVARLFDCFFTYEDTGGKKEVGIAMALRQLGIEPRRSMYIGDQPADLRAARQAEVNGVGVIWGFSNEAELRLCPHDLILVEPRQVGRGLLGIFRDS
jgi:phosphoglycolate phosphatase-like HAD superfamily hydrolase